MAISTGDTFLRLGEAWEAGERETGVHQITTSLLEYFSNPMPNKRMHWERCQCFDKACRPPVALHLQLCLSREADSNPHTDMRGSQHLDFCASCNSQSLQFSTVCSIVNLYIQTNCNTHVFHIFYTMNIDTEALGSG